MSQRGGKYKRSEGGQRKTQGTLRRNFVGPTLRTWRVACVSRVNHGKEAQEVDLTFFQKTETSAPRITTQGKKELTNELCRARVGREVTQNRADESKTTQPEPAWKWGGGVRSATSQRNHRGRGTKDKKRGGKKTPTPKPASEWEQRRTKTC